MKRDLPPLLLVLSLAACTSTSEPGPAGSVAVGTATSVAPPATASATTPDVAPESSRGTLSPATAAPSGSAPAPAAPFDPMAGVGTGPKDVTEVVPGVSIGPLKLGMSRAELKSLGYVAKPVTPEDDGQAISVIPYLIVLRDEKVDSIEATVTQMPKGLRIRGKVLSPRSTFAQTGAAFADCEPLRRGLGGDSFRCEGKRLLVKSGGGSHLIHVQIFAKPALRPTEEGSR